MTLRTALLNAVLPVVLCGTARSADTLRSTPGSLWHAALENSSGLTAARLLSESADYAFRGAGRLPDPSVRLAYSPGPVETRNGPVRFAVTLSQRIPWPGGLSDTREEMRYMSEVASLDETIESLRLRTEAAALWSQLYVARSSVSLLENELERLDHLAELADVRYRSGRSELSSLLLLENRAAVVGSALYAAALELESLEEELSSLIGVNDFVLEWADSLPAADYFHEGVRRTTPVEGTPAGLRSLARARAAEAAAAAAAASLYPGFEAGVTWSVIGEPEVEMGAVDPGRDGLTVFAGMSIPLGYSGAGTRSASSRISAAAAEHKHLQELTDREAMLQRGMNRVLSLLDMYTTYRETVVPNTEAMFQLAMADWLSGRTGIEEVLEKLGELEEARLEEMKSYGAMVTAYAGLLELEGRETMKGEFL